MKKITTEDTGEEKKGWQVVVWKFRVLFLVPFLLPLSLKLRVTPWFILGIICILPLSCQAAGGVAASALVIRDSESGRVYGRRAIDRGGEFAIEFIHSVNQSPVRETFKLEGKNIRPVSVRFYSFGAGMQSELEEGQAMERDGDALVITGFNRTFAELNYIVGTVSDHLLTANGETVSLREMCGKNAHITLRSD